MIVRVIREISQCIAAPEFSIGLDLGGTNLRAAAVDEDGKMLDSVSGKTAYSAGREAIIGDMVDAIETLRERCGEAKLAGIGVAVPGFILLKEGVIRNSNNLASLEDFPIRDEMSRRLGTRVILENDANAAALGEKWIGAGRGVDDLVLLTLGTGIGGGIVSNGKVLRGFLGHGGGARPHHRCSERKSVRLRQSRLRREACVGHRGDGDGEVAWPRRRD